MPDFKGSMFGFKSKYSINHESWYTDRLALNLWQQARINLMSNIFHE